MNFSNWIKLFNTVLDNFQVIHLLQENIIAKYTGRLKKKKDLTSRDWIFKSSSDEYHRAVILQHLLLIWIAFVTLEVFPLLLQELSCAGDHPLQILGRTRQSPAGGTWHLMAGVRDCDRRVLITEGLDPRWLPLCSRASQRRHVPLERFHQFHLNELSTVKSHISQGIEDFFITLFLKREPRFSQQGSFCWAQSPFSRFRGSLRLQVYVPTEWRVTQRTEKQMQSQMCHHCSWNYKLKYGCPFVAFSSSLKSMSIDGTTHYGTIWDYSTELWFSFPWDLHLSI